MSKISFLFGAGAEGKGQYGLPSGASFNRDLLVSENGSDFFRALNKAEADFSKFVNIKKSKNIYYNNYSSLYYLYKQSEEFRKFLSDDEKSICNDYLEYKEGVSVDKTKEDCRQKNFYDLFRNRFYTKIVKNDIANDYALKCFLENSLLIDSLDSSFNSLSCPEKFKNEAGRVISCYCSAYLSIYKAIYRVDIPKNRNEIVESINNPVGSLSLPEDSYYLATKRAVEKYKDIQFAFCTTNYTRIAETVIGHEKSFSYIHGRMDLFENLVTKEVKTLDKFAESDIVFPFLAIRSGIKPIINSTQIKEWNKFVNDLDDSDVLIIVGYGFNNDDEHITNLIREAISKNTIKVYQTNFDGSVGRTNSIPGIRGVLPIDCKCFEEKLCAICEEMRGK